MTIRDIYSSFAGLTLGFALLLSAACGDSSDPEPNPTVTPIPPTATLQAAATPTPRAAEPRISTPEPTSTPTRAPAAAASPVPTPVAATPRPIPSVQVRPTPDPRSRGGVLNLASAQNIAHQDVHQDVSPALSSWGPRHSLLQANALGDRARRPSSRPVPGVRYMRGLDDGIANVLPVQSARRRQVA